MNITKHPIARRTHATLLAAATVSAGVAGLLGMGGAAQASTADPGVNGWVVVDSCTSVAGQIHYAPGLRKTFLKNQSATLTGTTSGCSDLFSGAMSGTGTFTAILSGKASLAAENFRGTFTIKWPAGSGFNRSNGTLTVTESNGLENISGTVTSGFDTSALLAMQFATTGNTGTGSKLHPVTAQTYVNTKSLTLSKNYG